MKKTILLPILVVLTMLTNCNAETKKEKINSVSQNIENKEISVKKEKTNVMDVINIEYSNKIEGFNVSVVFKPITIKFDNIVGTAILEFDNGNKSFILTNNHFFIPSNLIKYTVNDDLKITSFNSKKIVLTYNKPKIIEDFEIVNVPFFFYDVNFDGEKELFLTEFGNGQRFVSSFKVFLLENGSLVDDYLQITNEAPYNELDGFSKTDRINNQIIIYSSGGICFGQFKTYKMKENKKLVLIKIVKEERDDNLDKCYEYTYKVIDGKQILVSKKENKM